MMFAYCIYELPKDYPNKFVIRQLHVVGGRIHFGLLGTADTLEGVRAMVPHGKVCLSRNEEDDPCIVETWI